MNVVEVKNVSKKFGKFTALHKIDLSVKKGEVFGFIGPNGAGKSTTIRILLGILKPNSGYAKLFGMDAWKDAVEIHKRISYVPGDVNLWPNLTGGEIIDLFMQLQGSNNKEKRDVLIQKFDLDPTKKCRTYSKGNRQKVALIAAFASDADLYILDEPTSGLDPLMERIFQECVEEIKEQGKSVLLSSHILSEVERLCDRVAIIREGNIIETGSINQLRHLTQTIFKVETVKEVRDLDKLDGINDLLVEGKHLSFQVDNENIENIMAYLVPYGIKKIDSTPPTLEELFMRHYEISSDEKEV
ncbi:MAG TPA: ABC transporter ATP-binding protein [Clostridiales bacterium]|nr:ABC transporter ATP-binding protein [Clostridiales bacterium]